MPVFSGWRALLALLLPIFALPFMLAPVLAPGILYAQDAPPAQEGQESPEIRDARPPEEARQGGPLSPEAARQFIEEHPDVFLVDLRTDREFSLGHLPGAVNIPARELEIRAQEVPAGRPVMVYCGLGFRSATSQRQLRHLRPDVGPVYYITGRPKF